MTDDIKKELIKNFGTWATTALVFILVFWAASYVFGNYGEPIKVKTETEGELDPYGRSKDIFTAILAMASIVIGYWFGNRGVAEANTNAQIARDDANAAQEAKDVAVREKEAVISTAGSLLESGTDIVAAAREAHPEMFGITR